MTRLASAMMVAGVGLSIFGAAEGDASAALVGPGTNGIVQGGVCTAELYTDARNVSYFAGNGGLAVSNANTWVLCPVANVTGLIASPTGVLVYVKNAAATTSTCSLHRVSYTSGAILATTSVTIPANMTSVQSFSIAQPGSSGNFYSLECLLSPGAQLMGYYVNKSS